MDKCAAYARKNARWYSSTEYLLSHSPLTYVPECADSYGDKECYRIFRGCENEVRRRYHQAIDAMEQDEALAIFYLVFTPMRLLPSLRNYST